MTSFMDDPKVFAKMDEEGAVKFLLNGTKADINWRNKISNAKAAHIAQVSTFFLFNVFLVTFDMATDFMTSINFFMMGNHKFAIATLLPIFGPFLAKTLLELIIIVKVRSEKNPVHIKVHVKSLSNLIWHIPFLLPLKNLRLLFGLFLLDSSFPHNATLISSFKKEAMGSGLYEAFLESAPQFILQCAIILSSGNITISQCIGIPLSFISLVLSGVKLFYSQRLGRFAEMDPSPKMLALATPFIILLILGPLFVLVMTTLYLKEFTLVFILLHLIINYLVLRKWLHSDRANILDEYKLDDGSNILTCDEEKANKESQSIFMAAVFTSIISPCCVWVNNFRTRTYFLTASSLTCCLSHIICLSLLHLILDLRKPFTQSQAPATYCFQSMNNSEFTNSNFTLDNSNVLKICHNDEECHSVVRMCAHGELPNDFFNKTIFPIGIALLVTSLISSLCLQMLSNSFTMYKWSSYIFKTPIIHPSFVHDYLRNKKSMRQQIQHEIEDVFEAIILQDPSVINRKDPLHGETCLHAAFNSELYDHVQRMIMIGGNGCISSIHNQTISSLLDKKLKEIECSSDEAEKLKNLKNFLNQIKGETDRLKIDKVWKENLLHKSIRKNNYSLLALLTLMGGHWNSKNENKRSALNYLMQKLDCEEGQMFAQSQCFVIWWIKNASDQFGQNILHHAAWNGTNRCIRVLLDLKADPNVLKTEDGKTPLHYSAQYGTLESAELLISYHADVDAQDFNGTTPLHEAAQRGFMEICQLLIKNQACVNAKDNQNKLPLHLAVENGHRECAELFQKYT